MRTRRRSGYPSHFAPAGMDLFALSNEEVERGVFWSLLGVGRDAERIRAATRQWLTNGMRTADLSRVW